MPDESLRRRESLPPPNAACLGLDATDPLAYWADITELLAGATPAALAEAVIDQRRQLHARPMRRSGRALAALDTALIDAAVGEILRRAWDQVDAEGHHCGDAKRCPIAIGALGSYGRRELMPHSDVDVLVVAPEGNRPGCDQLVRLIYHGIFDTLSQGVKLQVGYSCRSPENPGELDHKTQTALLDLRWVAGSADYLREFEAAVDEQFDRAGFLLALASERDQAGLDETPELYRIEPDLKRGPGALRDFLSGLSHARAAFRIRGPESLDQLAARSVLYDRELRELEDALSQILGERRALHIVAARPADVLYASLQEQVAAFLGYAGLGGLTGVGQLLRDHYQAARCLHHYSQVLCRRSHAARVRVGGGFVVCEREIRHPVPMEVVSSPELSVAAIALAHAYRVPIGADLADAIRLCADRLEPAKAPSPAAAGLVRILSPDGQPDVAMRYLRDLGLLGRLIPELGRCEDRIPSDPSHEYAILEHSLRVVEHVVALETTDDPALAALRKVYTSLSWTARRALLLAALMHDAGKVVDSRDHSTAGAVVTRNVGYRLGLPTIEVDRAARLVEIHLQMAQTSRLKPLHEPGTILEFREVVRDAETLEQLYLLTYADTKSVGRGVFRDIESHLLEDLYAKTLAALAGGMLPTDLQEAAQAITERAVREIRFRDISEDRVREHCQLMPPAYVVSTPMEAIASHIMMLRDLAADRLPVIDTYNPRDAAYTELTVCAYDDPQPGLFAKICGTLLSNGIDIHSAAIHTRGGPEPIALDTLLIGCGDERPPDDVLERTVTDLRAVLAGEVAVRALLERRRRVPADAVELISLGLRNPVADNHTIIEVKAKDARGLLYRLCRAIAECGLDLHSAQVTTWAGNAVDAFYVTHPGGDRLSDASLEPMAQRLRAAIEGSTHPATSAEEVPA